MGQTILRLVLLWCDLRHNHASHAFAAPSNGWLNGNTPFQLWYDRN